jgi:hypothetical protein
MIVVDTWLVYIQRTGTQEKQKDFYTSPSEEVIDNTYDHVHNGRRRRLDEHDASARSPELFDRTTGNPRAGTAAHLTPTKGQRLCMMIWSFHILCRDVVEFARS